MKIATCSYTEFLPAMGTPIRFTVGFPRFLRLDYKIEGWARLISPRKDMLGLPEDAYTREYLGIVNTAGVDAIRAELVKLAPASDQVVLLCFERLNEAPKAGRDHNWCHRSLFAQWWEAETGEVVPELGHLPACGVAYTPLTSPLPRRTA